MLEKLILRELVERVEAEGLDQFLVLITLARMSQGDKEAKSELPPEIAEELAEYVQVLSADALWKAALKYY